MGNLLQILPHSTTRPDSQHIGGPILRTPLSVMNAALAGWEGTECEGFEIRLLNCAEAHGFIRSKEKCKLLFQDFQECAQKMRQNDRIFQIRQEHRKEYWAGVAGLGPSVPKWGPKARQDAYAPDPWEDQWD